MITKSLSRQHLSWPSSPDASFFSQLPSTPGVYAFEDAKGDFLYIGKSIHLKNRIKQHWKASKDGEKQALFVPLTKKLHYYPVQSDLESLLLESRLIRLYTPLYNAISKDDKSPLYIQISGDAYPKVLLKRKSDLKKNDTAYGPFTSSATTLLLLKIARCIFRFCNNPPKNGKTTRACFYYHLGLCSGACVGKVSQIDYRKTIGLLKRFLNGQTLYVQKRLLQSINRSARQLHFEQAGQYKKQLDSLHVARTNIRLFGGFIEGTPRTDKQLKRLVDLLSPYGLSIRPDRIECYDMATLQQQDTVGSMVVLSLGIPDKTQYRRFKIRSLAGGDPHNMAEVLRRRFAHQEWPKPDLIVLDGGKTQLAIAGAQIPAGVPYISLAKKEEILIIPTSDGYQELCLPKSDPALQLIQIIRDEAHRFATSYHKKLRAKRVFD